MKKLQKLSNQSYAIPKTMMAYVIKYNWLEERVLDNFLLDKDNPEILTTNPEKNPHNFAFSIFCKAMRNFE